MIRVLVRAARALACLLAVAAAAGAQAQSAAAAASLEALASWVGGRWVAQFDTPDGRKFTVARTYQWTFDRRLLLGRSWADGEAKTRQTRETLFWWNPDTKRIEFQDFIDQGGYGVGFLEQRDGAWFMQARIVGNPKHPHWRAWLTESADRKKQTIRVQAEQGDKWVEFGVFEYNRMD
jgi:hypothetical protein